jgi:hypothetical protein
MLSRVSGKAKLLRRFSLLLLACVEVMGCGGMSSGASVDSRDASGGGPSPLQDPWSDAGSALPEADRGDGGDSANGKGIGEPGDGGDSLSGKGDGEAGDGGVEGSIPLCDVAHGRCVSGTNPTWTADHCGAAGYGGVEPGADLCWIENASKGLPVCRLPACDVSRQGQGCPLFEGEVACIDGEWRLCGIGLPDGMWCPGSQPPHLVPPTRPEGALCCPDDYGWSRFFGTPTGCCVDGRFAECVSHHVRYTSAPQCEARDAGDAALPDAPEDARRDAVPDVLTSE